MAGDDLYSKWRICHISTAHPANDVRIFYRECGSLAAIGCQTHLVIPAEASCTIGGVHVHAIPKVKGRLARMFLLPWRALFAALRTRANIYHYHDPELMVVGFVLRWVFLKRVVFDVHEAVARQIRTKEWLPPWSRGIVAAIYRIAEKVFTVGQMLVVANEPSQGDYPAGVVLVRNYPLIDTERLRMAEQKWPKSEIPLLIYIGSLDMNRGAFVYIELARRLSDAGRDFTLQIIGTYAPGLREQMVDRIQQYRLQGRVCLVDRIPYEQAMEIVSKAWIGLCLFLPSPHNVTSLSTKLLEYMMNGVPVLASNFPFWRPYIEETGAGQMVDPSDIDAVHRACDGMLQDPSRLDMMRECGLRAVQTKYNWSTEFQSLLRCYESLLNR
jgi:glycosyltransferase involved in cell wall biosynthesis